MSTPLDEAKKYIQFFWNNAKCDRTEKKLTEPVYIDQNRDDWVLCDKSALKAGELGVEIVTFRQACAIIKNIETALQAKNVKTLHALVDELKEVVTDPIELEPFIDAYAAPDGFVYEFRSIQQLYRMKRESNQVFKSPLTNLEMEATFKPIDALRFAGDLIAKLRAAVDYMQNFKEIARAEVHEQTDQLWTELWTKEIMCDFNDERIFKQSSTVLTEMQLFDSRYEECYFLGYRRAIQDYIIDRVVDRFGDDTWDVIPKLHDMEKAAFEKYKPTDDVTVMLPFLFEALLCCHVRCALINTGGFKKQEPDTDRILSAIAECCSRVVKKG